jgi:hypothetical protein
MSAVIRKPHLFEAARELRAYAAKHNLPDRTLLRGCAVAAAELDKGRTTAVAVCAAEKAMRDLGAVPTGGLVA